MYFLGVYIWGWVLIGLICYVAIANIVRVYTGPARERELNEKRYREWIRHYMRAQRDGFAPKPKAWDLEGYEYLNEAKDDSKS